MQPLPSRRRRKRDFRWESSFFSIKKRVGDCFPSNAPTYTPGSTESMLLTIGPESIVPACLRRRRAEPRLLRRTTYKTMLMEEKSPSSYTTICVLHRPGAQHPVLHSHHDKVACRLRRSGNSFSRRKGASSRRVARQTMTLMA